jgi:hypothetical protein
VLSKDVGDSSLVAVRKLEQLKKAVDDSSIKAQVRERVVRVSLQLFDSAMQLSRVARWFVFKPKIPTWVNFGRTWKGKC